MIKGSVFARLLGEETATAGLRLMQVANSLTQSDAFYAVFPQLVGNSTLLGVVLGMGVASPSRSRTILIP